MRMLPQQNSSSLNITDIVVKYLSLKDFHFPNIPPTLDPIQMCGTYVSSINLRLSLTQDIDGQGSQKWEQVEQDGIHLMDLRQHCQDGLHSWAAQNILLGHCWAASLSRQKPECKCCFNSQFLVFMSKLKFWQTQNLGSPKSRKSKIWETQNLGRTKSWKTKFRENTKFY